VLTLLALLLAQVVLGLFAVDVDGIESGPLSAHVSFETGRLCAHWHHSIFTALQVFVALHVLAVAWYVLVKKEDLVSAMLHGRRGYESQPVEDVRLPSWARIIFVGAIAIAIAWFVTRE
jgi:cytochrome b